MSKIITHRPSQSPQADAPSHAPVSPSVPRRSNKTSLGFICSPTTDISPPTSRSTLFSQPTRPRRPRSRLESLPRSLLSHIAYLVVVDNQGIGRSPSPLIPFFLSCRTIYNCISFDNNPQLYNNLFRATFDTAALDRRYEWMTKHLSDIAGRGRKIFDLFADPRSWAIDYKTRWEQSWRMREVAKHQTFEIPGVNSRDQLVGDLWNVWFLLTENDGRNIHFLAQECDFQQWIIIFYKEAMLKESLVPGYPKASGEKSLATWCALLSGADLIQEQTPMDVDEKIFVMRPFQFACAKYDITYAPWHHRRLPLCSANCTDHEPHLQQALPYKRFGYTWKRTPPHFIIGMYLSFFRLLERQPARMGIKPGSSTFSTLGSEPSPGLFSVTRILPSIYHDREWQRNSVCQDPHTSPGLPALTFRGELEGFWRAKFLFYDFDMYRQILAGNMRGVYTGTFGEQAVEMEVKETIIRIKKDEVGGTGPMLCAGFDVDESDDGEEERERILRGYGHPVWDGKDESDEEGWTKEILLSGRVRTSWGWASLRGRVRAWDGLVMLAVKYHRNTPMGCWLWRAYLNTGGHLIGRWRDTFTPEHLRGYEGSFGMIRAGDVFYPPSYPTKMDHSLGMDSAGPSNGQPGSVTYPSISLINRTYAIQTQEKSPRGLTGLSNEPEKRDSPKREEEEDTRRASDPGPPRRTSGREDGLYISRVQESSLRDQRE